jgi:hypothetical protein
VHVRPNVYRERLPFYADISKYGSIAKVGMMSGYCTLNYEIDVM